MAHSIIVPSISTPVIFLIPSFKPPIILPAPGRKPSIAALIASLPASLIGSSLSERKDLPLLKREPKPEGREILGKRKEILGNDICGSLKLKTKRSSSTSSSALQSPHVRTE